MRKVKWKMPNMLCKQKLLTALNLEKVPTRTYYLQFVLILTALGCLQYLVISVNSLVVSYPPVLGMVHSREVLHPSVRCSRVCGSSCWYRHGSCRIRQLFLQGSLAQPSSAVTATLPFTHNILHHDTMHSSIKNGEGNIAHSHKHEDK